MGGREGGMACSRRHALHPPEMQEKGLPESCASRRACTTHGRWGWGQ